MLLIRIHRVLSNMYLTVRRVGSEMKVKENSSGGGLGTGSNVWGTRERDAYFSSRVPSLKSPHLLHTESGAILLIQKSGQELGNCSRARCVPALSNSCSHVGDIIGKSLLPRILFRAFTYLFDRYPGRRLIGYASRCCDEGSTRYYPGPSKQKNRPPSSSSSNS